MSPRVITLLGIVLSASAWFWSELSAAPTAESIQQERVAAKKLLDDGNFAEAMKKYDALLRDPMTDATPDDVENYFRALMQLGQYEVLDETLESVAKLNAQRWRVLAMIGRIYRQADHQGWRIGNEFVRGNNGNRGQAVYVNSYARDRVRALQLFTQALPLAIEDPDRAAVSAFLYDFAMAWRDAEYGGTAWKLQINTDISTLPDYADGYWWQGQQDLGAPVDADGNPVFYKLAASYAEAANDGERWRWLLVESGKALPGMEPRAQSDWAQFLDSQFGVQTARAYVRPFDDDAEGDADEQANPYEVRTLKDEETLCRLATGVKRLTLPDEYNPLKAMQALGTSGKGYYQETASDRYASMLEDRRQFVRAADAWRDAIQRHGDQHQNRQARLDQIIKPWGRFEVALTQPAGANSQLEYRFRNATDVKLTAWPIRVPLLLDDVKAYLKSNPTQLDWERFNIQDLGYRLVTKNELRYVTRPSDTWNVKLEPAGEHQDRRITIDTPLKKAGAYLVTAEVAGGNVGRVILWISDTALVKKPLGDGALLYVADAVTGKPIEKANVELFGWRQEQVRPNENAYRVVTRSFARFTDRNGLVRLNDEQFSNNDQWMIVARTDSGRLAYLGFTHAWHQNYVVDSYQSTRVYAMTDRPVYRPEQKVQYKLWIQHASYGQPDVGEFANRDFTLQLYSPTGDLLEEKAVKTDDFGGVAGEYTLPGDAKLGVYSLQLKDHGGGNFRVEEYKKPEFEVTVDAPTEPVMLGDKITAKVTAKYYFGSPVAKGRIKYKITRTTHSARWFPAGRWDWFYGSGYWWFESDRSWYPGFSRWGCLPPVPWWWHQNSQPPELIADVETELPADGVLPIEIDTAPAKAVHGDEDHSYSISVEVTDESRRTITGSGSVLVARAPFKVYAWVNRGHFIAGESVEASFQAQTLAQKPVVGSGVLKLLNVTYDDAGKPTETVVETWELATNAEGTASQQFQVAQPGQYRLSYTVTDQQGRAIEGGYLFVVRGKGFDGEGFRFNDLELVPELREYKPGEKVRLMINTDQADATVLLFARPANGVYLPPQVVTMPGKSTVVELPVEQADQPNFFVEAVTIGKARVHSQVREIVVPPESRVLNLTVEPSQTEYLPGADAEVKVRVTDATGEPVKGSTVMTVYDRSVDYIAGGSNVPDIREFFWQGRRSHSLSQETSLDRSSWNLQRPSEVGMNDLGAFGDVILEAEQSSRFGAMGGPARGRHLRDMRRSGLMAKSEMSDRAMPMSAAAPAPAMAMDSLSESLAIADSSMAGGAFGGGAGGGAGGGTAYVAPTVRQNFADTAFWGTDLVTGDDGTAVARFKMPENLTSWKIRTWALGLGTRVAEATELVVTRKNLLVRLQAPRFFVEKDQVVLSANVHNYLKSAKSVKVQLQLEGSCLEGATPLETIVEIGPDSEQRVDWTVNVVREGSAIVRMQALTDEESDAMQQTFPVYVHGALKTESFVGVVRPGDESNVGKVTLRVPEERRPEQTTLTARFSPTLAGALVDALPYLVEYPYGCTEQTLNRFVPTVITQKVLRELNVDLAKVKEHHTNLNAQELGDPTKRASEWKHWDRNPVFDNAEVTAMVESGLERLNGMQLSDGGWGWFSGYGEQSSPHTTAVVVHGLQQARANDVALVSGVLERGIEWLKRYQQAELRKLQNAKEMIQPWKHQADATDAFIAMILADEDVAQAEMIEFLYRDRLELPVYAQALLGLTLQKTQQTDKLAMVLRNIEQFLVEDLENETAYLRLPNESSWWYWFGNEIEANAYYLKLLVQNDPKDVRASRLVKYLLNNRKHATYWNSTRDTALCIEALATYLRASGENNPQMTVQIVWDGQVQKEVQITPETLFTFDGTFELKGDAVAAGEHTLEFRRVGNGPLYYNAYLTNFTLEDPITRAGLELKVDRRYYKLTSKTDTEAVAGSSGQVINQNVAKFERTPLSTGDELTSGDLVEVELIIDSKNDYEYLVFEDFKAAGFEPVEVRSGYNTVGLRSYVEYRDEKVCFFAQSLPRGTSTVTYQLRAEIPGKFSALPTQGLAMYAPELRANSDEMKLGIKDRE